MYVARHPDGIETADETLVATLLEEMQRFGGKLRSLNPKP
jgi:hypothetical protein